MMIINPKLKDILPPVLCKRLDQNFRKKSPDKESIIAKSSKSYSYRRFVNRIPDWDLFCLAMGIYVKGDNFDATSIKKAEKPISDIAKRERGNVKVYLEGVKYKVDGDYQAIEIGLESHRSNPDINRTRGLGFDATATILETALILFTLGIESPFEVISDRRIYASITFLDEAKNIFGGISNSYLKILGDILLLDHGLIHYENRFLPFDSYFDFGIIRGYRIALGTNFSTIYDAGGLCIGSDFLFSESATATTAPHELMHIFDELIGLKYTDITAADSEFRAILAGTSGLDSEGKKYAMNNNRINMKSHPHHFEAGERIKKMFSKIPNKEIEAYVLRILNSEYKRLTSVYETGFLGLTYDDILEPWKK